MASFAVEEKFRPKHGGLLRAGPKREKRPLRELEIPPWHGWQERSESKRIIRWIEETLIQPIGVGQGEPFKVAKFQRDLTKKICGSLATFISIPAGNGKTTYMEAFALERLCRGDDYVEVDVLATKQDQANRLIEGCLRMIECNPRLIPLFEFYKGAAILEYRPTGSKLQAHPAVFSAIQGLNYDLALIDEISEVPAELVTTMIARLGKRPNQHAIGFGTPGFGQDNMLEMLRNRYHAGDLPPNTSFVEYAADAGCDIYDEAQQRKANPAIEAGFLLPESLSLKASIMPEHEFRAYHLGQAVESSGPWLPFGAWDNCIDSGRPRDNTPVVLAVWGNYRRQVAICGATLDGGIFFGWQSEKPTDEELGEVIRNASEQYELLEVSHKPHIRLNLMAKLYDEGLPVVTWPKDTSTDVESTAELWKAIADGDVAHDHDPFLSEQVARLTATIDRQGNPRLVEAEQDVSAALAARAAWWRARALAEADVTEPFVMY